MRDPYQFPAFRSPIDVRRHHHEGQEIIVLSCPLGVSPEPLGLLAATAPILQRFDGNHSIEQIAGELQSYGATTAIIEQLVSLIDAKLFLSSPRFTAARDQIFEGFLQSPVRAASLAGLSYPDTAPELTAHLDGLLATSLDAGVIRTSTSPLLALVSPHIDYHRGGSCYGVSWRALREHEHDLYIVMGTSHQYSSMMFHLTTKDFATPLGVLPCDRGFIARIADRYGTARSFADELLHRREHSLELQMPFLKRLKESATIAPILIGSFHHLLQSGKTPADFEEYESFVSSLAEVVDERRRSGARICFIAGVDMAHIGQFFGDKVPLSSLFLERVRERDHEYLSTILTHDKAAMFAHIEEDMDARRICGFPTMYLLLDLFERLGVRYSAHLLNYQQAVNYHTDCAVTFAGLGLYQAP